MTSPEMHKRCLDCGYILDGLPEPLCPECGRAFDPNKPETYVVKPKCGLVYLIAALSAVCSLIAACGMAVFVLWRLFSSPISGAESVGVCFALLLLFGGILLGSWTAGRCLKALNLPPAAMCHRSQYRIALVLSVPFRILLYLPGELTIALFVIAALSIYRLLS